MSYSFFSREARRWLERIEPSSFLLAADFDGTLTPLAAKSSGAFTPPATVRLLKEIQRYAPVAVISGRGLKDLKTRLGFKPEFLVGNHGMEGAGFDPGPAKEIARAWVKQLAGTEGVEDKAYSLSLHYRAAKDRAKAKADLGRRIKKLSPQPHQIGGKCVINLLPPGSPNKGTALQAILDRENIAHCLFLGDDDTDEDVFKLKDKRVVGIRVCRRISKARYHVTRQSDVTRILEMISERVSSLA